ncbi:putative defense protein 3 [Halotydeus destructor]|nr:putative defense protein 3 [Halotydeus destructor]
MIAQLVLVFALATPLYSYPSGAPKEACTSLRPGHDGSNIQTSPAPYEVQTDSALYSAGNPVTLTITGKDGETFKGFIMAARQAGSTANIGEFVPTDDSTTTLKCTEENDTITHSNNDDKSAVTFVWSAPDNFKGNVHFNATIVKSYDTYWTNVLSRNVLIN